jgi:hypothetical protein
MLGDVPAVDYEYEDRLITRLDLRALVAKTLTNRQRRIVAHRIRGSTLKESGELEGLSRGRIQQIYEKSIRRLKFKATGKREEDALKPFMSPMRDYPTPPPGLVIQPPVAWIPSASTYLTTEMITEEAVRLWKTYNALQRDRIIITVYADPWGLSHRRHTERAAFTADIREMMGVGNRIEVLADGVCTKLALHGDKWRLVDV